MKKIIAVILVCILTLSITSCSSNEKNNDYFSDDRDYLMINDEKYVPFVLPDGLFRKISFVSYQISEEEIWFESELSFPQILKFIIGSLVFYDASLPQDIDVKFSYEYGTFCLEDDKEELDKLLSNIVWDDVIGIQGYIKKITFTQVIVTNKDPVFFSEELKKYFFTWLDNWDFEAETIWVYIDPDECKEIDSSDIYIYDTTLNFRQCLSSFVITENGVYLEPDNVAITYNPNMADYNLSEMTDLRLPDEFEDEFYNFVYDK